MSAAILAIGTATPDGGLSRERDVAFAAARSAGTREQERLLRSLYRRSGVRRRATVFGERLERVYPAHGVAPAGDLRTATDLGPTTGERLAHYLREAAPLARDASARALAGAALAPDAITHLVTVSCTGFAAPGVDAALVRELGLRRDVQRTHVGYMGCHGALNGLRVARAVAEANPDERVLLCAVEICSLHFRYGWDRDRVVANALFADGAAALVVAADAPGRAAPWRVADTASRLLPDSSGAMSWSIGDHGFEMTLSPRVPDLLRADLRPWLEGWLDRHGLDAGRIGSWAVHPGGPRVLAAVADALALPPDGIAASRAVLADHGNMSSPTVLFILQRLAEAEASRPCVALAFGPGLQAEAALLR